MYLVIFFQSQTSCSSHSLVNELIDMSFDIPSDTIDCARIKFKLKNELVDGVPTETSHEINIGKSDIKILLKEMKTVRSLMDETE